MASMLACRPPNSLNSRLNLSSRGLVGLGWSRGHRIPAKRAVITYFDLSVVTPPLYDTNHSYLYWTGDFSGAGKAEVLFWFEDGNWSLGTLIGNQMSLTN